MNKRTPMRLEWLNVFNGKGIAASAGHAERLSDRPVAQHAAAGASRREQVMSVAHRHARRSWRGNKRLFLVEQGRCEFVETPLWQDVSIEWVRAAHTENSFCPAARS